MIIDKQELLERLDKIRKKTSHSRIKKVFSVGFPFWRHVFIILFGRYISNNGLKVRRKLFTGQEFNLLLPASADIYLFGAKPHISEIKLSKFLIRYLENGDQYIDVGAHFGFFSQLAAHLTGEKGKILAYEPSPRSFNVLKSNTLPYKNVVCIQKGISDTKGSFTLREYDLRYSEYNSFDTDSNPDLPYKSHLIECTTLDDEIVKYGLSPKIIKIDVEGLEPLVIKGLSKTLSDQNVSYLIMEILPGYLNREDYISAFEDLKSLGFEMCMINAKGKLNTVDLKNLKIDDSDNVVFRRK